MALNKGCPFCEHGELNVRRVELGDNDYRAVLCLNCGAWGPLAANEREAWRRWNAREHRHVYGGADEGVTCVCGAVEARI